MLMLMRSTDAPRCCENLFCWIIAFFVCIGFANGAQAQTVLFSEDFESWNGSFTCLTGWSCSTTPTCTSGLACSWGRNDIFGPAAQPATTGCDGNGFYARSQTSQIVFGDLPILVTPVIDLSSAQPSDPVEVRFCLINSSTAGFDTDGLQVFFSNDSGQTWQLQILDFNVYNTWDNQLLAVPPGFKNAGFQVKFESIGNLSTGDIGIDDVEVINMAPVCDALPTNISLTGDSHICKDAVADPVLLNHNASSAADYTFFVTDTGQLIVSIIPDSLYDFNELAPAQYEVFGVSHEDVLNASVGMPFDSVSSAGCLVISTNRLQVEVQELSLATQVISDYNGAQISVNGASDGMAQAIVSGGSGMYDYSWNTTPVQISAVATGLSAGQYEVTTTDSTGCVATESVMLVQPEVLAGTFSASDYHGQMISCAGADDAYLKIHISGGVAPYQIDWAHDMSLKTDSAAGLAAGIYSAVITDANGATDSISIEVSEPEAIQVNGTITPLTCNGGADANISIAASGGAGNFSYNWSNGSSQPVLSGIPAGVYQVRVSDANGCEESRAFTINDLPPMVIDGMIEHNICYGDSAGFIGLTVQGGEAPYGYEWSNGSASSELFNLTAGKYVVTVTDANGCTSVQMFDILEPESMTLQISSRPDNGLGVGEAMVSVSGGDGNYQYSWSNGDTASLALGLSIGTYGVTVTDGQGCKVTEEVEISIGEKPDCLEIHMGFSPNGDGINETWYIPCITYFPDNEVTIINRWGQELYHIFSYDNTWDGTTNGTPLPDGTYFYIVDIKTNTSRRQFKGTVSILR